jgi:tellurite resistance protein TerC
MFFERGKEIHPERNPVLRLARRFLRVTSDYREDHFFVREAGKLFATPLFIVLLCVETTDVVFAVDSIPAILGITQDRFIVYTSNAFAIVGLRAIYFALAGVMRIFHLLHYGLSLILVLIGVKMLLSFLGHIPIEWALGAVVGIVALSVVASLIWPRESAPYSDEVPEESEQTE